MIIKILILVIAYILCAYYGWRYIHLSYSKGGQWENLQIPIFECLLVFAPIVNFISTPLLYFIASPRRDNRSEFMNKVFKVKK